jgi:microcystin-dependent protein
MTPFLGQLMLASWNYANTGYTMCNGQLLPINSNQALFALLGTTYGGDGIRTFGLPNLQGRTPISFGNGFVLGEMSGEDHHTLLTTEVPPHSHFEMASSAAPDKTAPGGNLLANGSVNLYATASNLQPMNHGSIGITGGSQSHENRQPFLVMTWLIALTGIFPSQN